MIIWLVTHDHLTRDPWSFDSWPIDSWLMTHNLLIHGPLTHDPWQFHSWLIDSWPPDNDLWPVTNDQWPWLMAIWFITLSKQQSHCGHCSNSRKHTSLPNNWRMTCRDWRSGLQQSKEEMKQREEDGFPDDVDTDIKWTKVSFISLLLPF